MAERGEEEELWDRGGEGERKGESHPKQTVELIEACSISKQAFKQQIELHHDNIALRQKYCKAQPNLKQG